VNSAKLHGRRVAPSLLMPCNWNTGFAISSPATRTPSSQFSSTKTKQIRAESALRGESSINLGHSLEANEMHLGQTSASRFVELTNGRSGRVAGLSCR
jgi:hypothetical protein